MYGGGSVQGGVQRRKTERTVLIPVIPETTEGITEQSTAPPAHMLLLLYVAQRQRKQGAHA